MGGGTAWNRVGPPGHVHGGDGAGRPDDDVPAAYRDPSRILATRRTSPRQQPRSTTSAAGGCSSTSSRARTTWPHAANADEDQSRRYERTKEFLQIVRRLWTEEDVTFRGAHFSVDHATRRAPRPSCAASAGTRGSYFGGASPAAERVAATEADVQLFWASRSRASRSGSTGPKRLSAELGARTRHSSSGCGSRRSYATPPNRRGRTPKPRSAEMAKDGGSREEPARRDGPGAWASSDC